MGRPGAGKSLYATIRLLRAVRGGRVAWSNLYPRWPGSWRWANWPMMREAGEGFFVVDEAQVWFNSRAFANNTGELASWQQSRKRGSDMLWVAQHESRVDVAIRELTSIVWRPRIIGPVLIAMGTTLEGERAGVDFAFYRSAFGAYHTDQVIGERADPFAILARVASPLAVEAPLYAGSPTHYVPADCSIGRVEWLPWFEGVTGIVYAYQDYSGDWWRLESDENGWRVVEPVRSAEASVVAAVRRRLMTEGASKLVGDAFADVRRAAAPGAIGPRSVKPG